MLGLVAAGAVGAGAAGISLYNRKKGGGKSS
jgi:hypothetical protein